MRKVDIVLANIKKYLVQIEKEDIADEVADFPGVERINQYIEDFETEIAKLLRAQRKYYVDAFNSFVTKDDSEKLESFLIYLKNDLFALDEFKAQFGELAAKFLELSISELTALIMESIDRDIAFEVLSERTTNWITTWSSDLADLMELNTHTALESELLKAIQDGESIAQTELRIKDLKQFDRNRARATARTEILTASSRANYESFQQSPAVEGKKWKHSGTKKITPRPAHVAMDGVVVGVDEYFLIDGEMGLYPRDPNFSAKNRVSCGCAVGPVINESILGLSKEEKEALRQEVLNDLNN